MLLLTGNVLCYAVRMDSWEFQRVIEQGRQLQARLADTDAVAVGGTAAALHCGHRFSLDVDVVTPHLSARFDQISANLESWAGWRTNRRNPPVLILGEHDGVELGIRQLRREVPLQTATVGGLRIPTGAEMLRVKAFLLMERRAVRDFVDVAALGGKLDGAAALQALSWLNLVYPPRPPQTWATRFAEACEAEPADLAKVSLAAYRGLRTPFTDWPFIAGECRKLGRALLKLELDGALPSTLPPNWLQGERA